jgi:translation elongation factor EF-1alpha
MSEITEKEVGIITNFFERISVAGIDLTGTVKVGDNLHFKGATTDFTQQIESMQIEHQNVTEAHAKDAIGIKVKEKVRKGDKVYLISQG